MHQMVSKSVTDTAKKIGVYTSKLSAELRDMREAVYPPEARKTFSRTFSTVDLVRLLGVPESTLRQLTIEGKGPFLIEQRTIDVPIRSSKFESYVLSSLRCDRMMPGTSCLIAERAKSSRSLRPLTSRVEVQRPQHQSILPIFLVCKAIGFFVLILIRKHR